MKTRTIIFFAGLCSFFIGCTPSTSVAPTPTKTEIPSFNQVNIALDPSHSQCLLDQWYNRRYQNEPIVFRVINDTTAYAAFFPCKFTTALPQINFTSSSLLIGMKADYGQFINTPTNISSITQTLTPTTSGNYELQVKVVGGTGKSLPGGEWFAFVAVVPKITGTVTLNMQYQFK